MLAWMTLISSIATNALLFLTTMSHSQKALAKIYVLY